ncbi:MAG: hypothetical protein GX620_18550 [Chloroflexi bacterium]|nr:hypothetical protein [Chloroflexota bacterium]
MRQFWNENRLVIGLITLMVGAFLLLRTPGDTLPSTADFDALVSAGTPTLVEFYSNT